MKLFHLNVNRSPRGFALLCLRYMNAVLVPVGITIGMDCRRTIVSILPIFCVAQHSLLCIYTACYYWSTNRVSSVQPLALIGVTVPVGE